MEDLANAPLYVCLSPGFRDCPLKIISQIVPPVHQTSKIEIIEVMRFFAALLVVFVHIPLFGFGRFGVDLFFVISGFVMMLATSGSGRHFLHKRIIRVVPIYWMSTLAAFVFALLLPGVLDRDTASVDHLLQSLAFVPFAKGDHGYYPTLQVGWTLNFEMYFYVVFAVALAMSQKFRGELSAIIIVLVAVVTQGTQNATIGFYSETVVVEFIFGIIVYRLSTDRNWHAIAILSLLALIPYFTVVETETAYSRLISGPHLRGYEWGIPAAATVLVALLVAPKLTFHPLLTVLGGASYALYLIHMFVIGIVWNILFAPNLGPGLEILASLLAIGVSVALAVGFHLGVEKPMTDALRRRALGQQPAPAPGGGHP